MAAAAIALLASACGATETAGQQSPRNAAVGQAAALLRLAAQPPRTTEIASLPAVSGPAMGLPGTNSLVDRTRFWKVPMSASDTVRWLTKHPPPMKYAGNMTGSGGISGVGYAIDVQPPLDSAQLQFGVVPLGPHAAGVRVDALVTYLDDSPMRDDASGPRMRVTVTSGCPASDASYVGVSNPGTGLDKALLPPGPPTGGLTCEYAGLNGPRNQLVAQRTLDAAAARTLAGAAGQLSLAHLDDAVHSCPMDDGSLAVVALSYADRPDVDLWYTTTGCRTVRNGHIVADASTRTLPLG